VACVDHDVCAEGSRRIELGEGMDLKLARVDAIEARAHHRFAGGAARFDGRDDFGGSELVERFDGSAPPRRASFNHHGFAGR
jgi:hypothetical protein